jgi:hypothetical protein
VLYPLSLDVFSLTSPVGRSFNVERTLKDLPTVCYAVLVKPQAYGAAKLQKERNFSSGLDCELIAQNTKR